MILIRVLALLAFSFANGAALAACMGQIGSGYAPPPITTDPFSVADTVLTDAIPVSISSADTDTCILGLTFESDQRTSNTRRLLSGPDGNLGYFIEDVGQNMLRSDDRPSNASLLRLSIPVSGGQGEGRASLRFRIASDANSPPGLYRGGVTVRLFDLSGKKEIQLDERRFEVTTTVRSGMLISLGNVASGNGNATALLDLGQLFSGLQHVATFSVRSNSAYTLRVTSQNRGRLVLRDTAGGYGTAAEIPYLLSVGGYSVPLGSGTATPLSAAATTAQGQSYPLDIRIPSADNKLSGLYEDILSLTIEAR